MKKYIAYGSNLNKEQMQYRCPDAKVFDTATLNNYKLEFKGGASGHLTIDKERGEHNKVPVAIWEISKEDEKNLDRYEGYPNYYIKKTITVDTKNNGKIKAMAYIMNDRFDKQMPCDSYLATCVEGYKAFNFKTQPLWEAYYRAK